MKKILYITLFLFTLVVQAQNEQLANNYFDRGEFEKALVNYEDLLKSNIGNSNYFERVIQCQQQLLQFDKAEKGLLERFDKFKQNSLLVELGYNYQLQKNEPNAKKYYDQANRHLNRLTALLQLNRLTLLSLKIQLVCLPVANRYNNLN